MKLTKPDVEKSVTSNSFSQDFFHSDDQIPIEVCNNNILFVIINFVGYGMCLNYMLSAFICND